MHEDRRGTVGLRRSDPASALSKESTFIRHTFNRVPSLHRMAPPIDPAIPPIELLSRFGPGSQHPPPSLEASMAYVRGLARSHYENFHVLSALVPSDLRDDFAAVYAFCRWADDLGDETGNTDAARDKSLSLLAWWRRELQECFAWVAGKGSEFFANGQPSGPGASPGRAQPELDPAGSSFRESTTATLIASSPEPREPTHPVFLALAATVRRHGSGRGALTVTPFDRLIQAFELDQSLHHYQTWDQLLHYCTLSANPVGRIVLALAGYADTPQHADLFAMSDATCTALQLTNHWQDVRRDLLEKDRVYVPSAETGITPEILRDWASRPDDPDARVPYITKMRELVNRTGQLFDAGRGLPARLDSRIAPVVWLFGAGGRSVLRAVERAGCTTLWNRPTLTPSVKAWLLARAWLMTKLPVPRAFSTSSRQGCSSFLPSQGEQARSI